MRWTVFLALSIALTACASSEEKNRKRAEADHRECVSYGASFGTPAYTNCRVGLQQVREQRRAAIIGAWASTQPTRTRCSFIGYVMNCY